MTDIRSFLEWTQIGQKAMTAGRKDQRETRKEWQTHIYGLFWSEGSQSYRTNTQYM